jgi:hypothetical protein
LHQIDAATAILHLRRGAHLRTPGFNRSGLSNRPDGLSPAFHEGTCMARVTFEAQKSSRSLNAQTLSLEWNFRQPHDMPRPRAHMTTFPKITAGARLSRHRIQNQGQKKPEAASYTVPRSLIRFLGKCRDFRIRCRSWQSWEVSGR